MTNVPNYVDHREILIDNSVVFDDLSFALSRFRALRIHMGLAMFLKGGSIGRAISLAFAVSIPAMPLAGSLVPSSTHQLEPVADPHSAINTAVITGISRRKDCLSALLDAAGSLLGRASNLFEGAGA